ncbi:hypothetical protein [Sphingobium sp. WCS2017Hpa-17]|uniref:hypothetical protein n=1 Tax=Sphingobium sp. WCS2017Hpa-17 TaxID=3073638 RepID=UPI00288C15E6|nr:hypothetical protein [Sphingobium sp. WCS2017Hpa-17]
MTNSIVRDASGLENRTDRFLLRVQAAFTNMQRVAYPRISGVRKDDFLDDIEIMVEVAPGLIMIESPNVARIDLSAADYPELVGEALHIRACRIAQQADYWLARKAAILAEIEPVLAAAQQEGLPIRMQHIYLFDARTIGHHADCDFLLVVETLDDRLRPVEREVSIEPGETFCDAIARQVDAVRPCAQKRQALRQHQADGTVDRFTLNVIAKYGDVAQCLRALRDKSELVVGYATYLFWEEGHVWSSRQDHPAFNWSGRTLTVQNQVLPETVCARAVGASVTKVYPHKLLSDDMLVKEIVNCNHDPFKFLLIDIDAPVLHFDSRSGRVW